MSAQKRKSKTSRRKKKKGVSFFSIFIILIIIAFIATILVYFFYSSGKKVPPRITSTLQKTEVPVSKKKAAPAVQLNLNGSWVSSADGRILDIHGNRFTLDRPSVSDQEIVHGTIKLKGHVATIGFSGTNDKCSLTPGIYEVHLSKGTLRFIVKKDDCPGRKLIFSASWSKF